MYSFVLVAPRLMRAVSDGACRGGRGGARPDLSSFLPAFFPPLPRRHRERLASPWTAVEDCPVGLGQAAATVLATKAAAALSEIGGCAVGTAAAALSPPPSSLRSHLFPASPSLSLPHVVRNGARGPGRGSRRVGSIPSPCTRRGEGGASATFEGQSTVHSPHSTHWQHPRFMLQRSSGGDRGSRPSRGALPRRFALLSPPP